MYFALHLDLEITKNEKKVISHFLSNRRKCENTVVYGLIFDKFLFTPIS